jgi:hypothetical protein
VPLLRCRLENGLHKLHKTQSEVDVLVENARAMAIEVEQKVANANVFAEQVRTGSHQPTCLTCDALAQPLAQCMMQNFVRSVTLGAALLTAGWCGKGEGQCRE